MENDFLAEQIRMKCRHGLIPFDKIEEFFKANLK